MKGEKIYGIADRAWQVVVGCDPHMTCAPRCWARKTVARVAECQKVQNPKRSEFYQIALTPDGQQWSGRVLLDERHLRDPFNWRKPAIVAAGFHGDIARLDADDFGKILTVIRNSERHTFMLLTKCPEELLAHSALWRVLPNVNLGCSVMNQAEADRMREPMAKLAAMGWRTHVWYEPALGPVNWTEWVFLSQIIIGGESGTNARTFTVQWVRDTRDWAKAFNVACFVKQMGAVVNGDPNEFPTAIHDDGDGHRTFRLDDPKGSDASEWPADLRVREVRL